MTEAGFVVNGNAKAWGRHFLRAVALGLVTSVILSLTTPYLRSHMHQSIPINIVLAEFVSNIMGICAIVSLTMALLHRVTSNTKPLVSVNQDGVLVNAQWSRARRLGWSEIKQIYIWKPCCDFRVFSIPLPERVVVIPHNPESLYGHLTDREKRWLFGSANPTKYNCRYWTEIATWATDLSSSEFMQQLNTYYQKYAWRPGLPGGPYPSLAARNQGQSAILPTTSAQIHEPIVEQSRDVCAKSPVLNSGTTQRRALHRTARPLNAGIRRRMPYNRGAERMSAMLKQDTETQTIQTVPSIPNETDTRVTPDELTAALEAIERRKAEVQKRLAETIPVDQAVRELGIDATPEEVLAEVRAQRAARAKLSAASAPGKPTAPAPPLVSINRTNLDAFIRDVVKESGIEALPAEIIARLRARRLAREQGIAHDASQTTATSPRSQRKARRGIGIGIGVFFFFALSTGWFRHAPSFPSSPSTGPISVPLSTIPDNHPVTSDTASLQEIAEGKPANTITVIDNEDMDNNRDWTVFKKSGHYYIEAYLPARVSPEALKTAPIKIYNDHSDTPGNDEVKVTVQIDGTKVVASHDDGEDSTITLSNLHPDGIVYHASDD